MRVLRHEPFAVLEDLGEELLRPLVTRIGEYLGRQTLFNVQGFVGSTMVFHGDIFGVPLQRQGEVSSGEEE